MLIAETINGLEGFVKFISDDPVMLGLCCAIIFLIIIFIAVLCFGGKKKTQKENTNESLDNTTQILKVSTEDEPLRSTQEFNLNSIQEKASEDKMDETAPISIEEALELKVQLQEPKEEIKPIPVVVETTPKEVEIPVENLKVNESQPQTEQITQPFSSVYVNESDEIPRLNSQLRSADIIRHTPQTKENIIDSKQIKDDNILEKLDSKSVTEDVDNLDDIELPKLNKNEETSVMNTLSGESFRIY